LLAVTGLLMIFRPQLEPVVERGLRDVGSCHARQPLDELIAGARRVHPDGAVTRIEILEGGYGATTIRFADTTGVTVNPCTGSVLGQRHQWGGLFGTIEQWHRLRFVDNPDITELIGGSVSLLLALIMVVGGAVLWWPPSLRALKSSFKFRWHLIGGAFERSLHRSVGTYAGLVLLMSAATSLTFTFDWARNALFFAAGSRLPAPKPAVKATNAAMLPAEIFIERALSMLPNAREITLTYPRNVRDAVEIYAIERGAPHPNARSYVYLNPYTADVLRFEPYAASSAGNKIYRWLGSLHTAKVGGLPVQLLLFAGILGVPVLAYTGIRSALRCVPLANAGRKPVMRAQEQGPPAESLNTNSQCSQIDFRPRN
jgi:vanillate O-demethylase ferredoxin subunit